MSARVVQVASMNGPLEAAVSVGPHSLLAGEPLSAGGNDAGPNPFEYLAAALGSCTVLTVKMYAERKQWPLVSTSAEVTSEKVGEVFQLRRTVSFEGALDEEQRKRLLEIANKCPVHRALSGTIEIKTSMV